MAWLADSCRPLQSALTAPPTVQVTRLVVELEGLQAVAFHAVDDDVREKLLLDRPSTANPMLLVLANPRLKVVGKIERQLVLFQFLEEGTVLLSG
jgi:hypothetical protein